MSSTDPEPKAFPTAQRRGSGRLGAFFARVGLWRNEPMRAGDSGASARPPAGADLMAHARAFQTLSVADVMTPRADIMAVELSSSFDAVVAAFAESEHSRLPVYRDSLDDPVGVAHLKDVFKLLAGPEPRREAGAQVLRRLKRETLYVPPSMRAADLLVRMQASRIHMAMVIDEFGGVDGVVTLEDVIEAVVGEIDDEHDEAASTQIVARAGGVFEIDARVALESLETALRRGLATPDMDEDIDTAAGLVTALAGRVPQRGEVIAHPAGLDFEVTDADPRRVKRLRIRPAATPPKRAPAVDG
ncbi:MAG: HlyC/CorC family transporter [Caulobacteraceae bacterium]|nr:HlyC/CorC family transporter [Caulobacteraceae bacterium]